MTEAELQPLFVFIVVAVLIVLVTLTLRKSGEGIPVRTEETGPPKSPVGARKNMSPAAWVLLLLVVVAGFIWRHIDRKEKEAEKQRNSISETGRALNELHDRMQREKEFE